MAFTALTQERRIALTFSKVRVILDELTPNKFAKLSNDLLNIDLNGEFILKGVILLIFEKALDKPRYSSLYAQLCRLLSDEAPNFEPQTPGIDGQKPRNTFRILLLNRCKTEFENRSKASEDFEIYDDVALEEEEQRELAKRKMLGNIKFIGELGKLEIVSDTILHKCIQQLLIEKKQGDTEKNMADDMECLCQIMRTCGRTLDSDKGKGLMKQYFERMSVLAESRDLPLRIRFMLRDVIELRRDNWESVPIHQENVPTYKQNIDFRKTNKTEEIEQHNTMKALEGSLNNTSINVNQIDAKGGENRRVTNAPNEAANIPDIMHKKISNCLIHDENNSIAEFEVSSCIADNEFGKLSMQTYSRASTENNLHLSNTAVNHEEMNISVLNNLRRILRTINAASFNRLSNAFLNVDIYTDEITNGIIDLIFDAMINKPSNIRLYAKLCTRLFLEIPSIETSSPGDAGYMRRSSFRTRFIKRCEHEFRNRSSKSEECKKHIEFDLLDHECCQIARHRMLSIIELIGELYNFGNFSTNSVICNCVTDLLSKKSGTDAANVANDVVYARHLIRICGRKFALDGGKQFLFPPSAPPTNLDYYGNYSDSKASEYNTTCLPVEICKELWRMMEPNGSDWSQA